MPSNEHGSRDVDFVLGDGEALNREHPRTFEIPSREERERLKPGDLVKLLFEILRPEPEGPFAERMWVEVTEIVGDGYVGSLDNDPQVIRSVRPGGRIEFLPHHVIAIWDDGV
ncbi:DUF2314 domain-containing protein [Nocardioides acrostichi]|uniref:DUF2314 domain-containing protein n=1 Tax=Nocardioides acrostichi TaxID=2784339 RepID=UPI002E28BE0A|nr:DUF2314 domain-containing protein [Nocardioides acrostichi]